MSESKVSYAWAQNLTRVPIGVFHGAEDEEAPLQETLDLLEALKDEQASVRTTIVPDANHSRLLDTYWNKGHLFRTDAQFSNGSKPFTAPWWAKAM